jgi:uncharacterized protein YbjT (DUF2867 family)
LGRSEGKLAALKRAGAEVPAGDTNDATFLTKAFAIRDCGVRYIVALSSLGADLTEGTGVIAGLHAHEERLKQLKGVNVLLLRPVSFFENFYETLGLIKHEGINGDSVAADLAVPMVATRDIADAAAKALKARDWKGVVVRESLGPRDLSYSEAAQILGERIGKPDLQYVQLSYADEEKALVQAGMSESFANLYVEMTRSFNERIIKPQRTPQNTTATRFEDFAGELARAYAVV